jgi:hypothetical protein
MKMIVSMGWDMILLIGLFPLFFYFWLKFWYWKSSLKLTMNFNVTHSVSPLYQIQISGFWCNASSQERDQKITPWSNRLRVLCWSTLPVECNV